MLIKRKLTDRILPYLGGKEVIAIHGARQVGKTSLMEYLMENHLHKHAKKENIFYFDLEDFVLLELCNKGADEVVRYLKTKGALFPAKIFLLIDEVQYMDNPSAFLKLMHDRYGKQIQLIVSGSSSFDIKRKFKDSLAGRIIDFELFTLDFQEFLTFKGKHYDLENAEPAARELQTLYEEYVIFGGYPGIVLSETEDQKETRLKQIINAYVKKDIRDIAAIRHVGKFNDLLMLLARQSGSLINIAELSASLKLSKQTVEEYLFILESTYFIKMIRPFHKNIRSELTKMPKVYIEDNGMLNMLTNKTFSKTISGESFETSIFGQLRRNMPVNDIYFWRLIKGNEVDFILHFPAAKNLIPLEVKSLGLDKHLKQTDQFKTKYQCTLNYVCCLKKRTDDKRAIYPWDLYSIIKKSDGKK